MKLESIQNAVADLLKKISRLNKAGMTVLTENKTDLVSAIDCRLGKFGAGRNRVHPVRETFVHRLRINRH